MAAMFTCPECEQTINQATEVCPYCRTDLTARPAGESREDEKKPSTKRIVLILGVVLAIVWAIAWFALPWKLAGSRPEAESGAREALASVQAVLTAYQASEGTFPSSLEGLSEGVRTAAQKAQAVHYTIQYTPGQPDSSGRVKSYALTATSGNSGYFNFYTDESGVLHTSVEHRPATVQDPPLKPTS